MVLHAPDRARVQMKRVGSLRLPPHEATTAQLGAAYPFAASLPLPVGRVLVGRDLAGGPFAHDPFELYASGALTNPNITVLGQIGRGKSALVKTYLLRQAAFGRRIAVLDPKGEYESLALALGTVPIKLSPRGGTRINPLEAACSGADVSEGDRLALANIRLQRLTLLAALAEATLHRRLSPIERLAVEPLSMRARASALPPPSVKSWRKCCRQAMTPRVPPAPRPGRSPPTAGTWDSKLRRLVLGDLAGMFDGTTTGVGTASADALVVDLSDVYHSEALPALMVCAASWLQSMTSGGGGAGPAPGTVFVVDEAWAVLSEVAVGRYLRSSWKLARARGLANIAVCHRASDLASAGAHGSEEVRLAEGLLADSETVVCYAQPASELGTLAGLLGCSVDEIEYLPRLARGVALWRVGDRRFLVEHLLSSAESAVVDTDARLLGASTSRPMGAMAR